MTAFGFEPSKYPPDEWWHSPPTRGQMKYLRVCRVNGMYTGPGFRKLCGVILEAYGFKDEINCQTAAALIDFFKEASSGAKNKAWRETLEHRDRR